MFSQVCVKNSVHRGDVYGGGRVHCRRGHGRREGVCMAGGMCGNGACMVGGVHGMGGVHGRGHVWHKGSCMACTLWQILQDTVNEQAVRILLECILVFNFFTAWG